MRFKDLTEAEIVSTTKASGPQESPVISKVVSTSITTTSNANTASGEEVVEESAALPENTVEIKFAGGSPCIVRLVHPGDSYGLNMKLANKTNEDIIEFYDGDYVDEFMDQNAGLPLGQFVSRYYVSTIAKRPETRNGINLEGSEEKWRISGSELNKALTELGVYAKEVVEEENDIFKSMPGRKTGLEYTEKKVKEKLDRVTTELDGLNSATFTKIGKKYEELEEIIASTTKKRNDLNDELKQLCSSLFDAEDEYLTRVVETVSLTMTLAKGYSQKSDKIEWEKIATEIMALLEGDLKEKAEKIKEQYTTAGSLEKVNPKFDIKIKKESIGSGFVEKIKSYFNNFLNYINSWGKNYDKKLSAIASKININEVVTEDEVKTNDIVVSFDKYEDGWDAFEIFQNLKDSHNIDYTEMPDKSRTRKWLTVHFPSNLSKEAIAEIKKDIFRKGIYIHKSDKIEEAEAGWGLDHNEEDCVRAIMDQIETSGSVHFIEKIKSIINNECEYYDVTGSNKKAVADQVFDNITMAILRNKN